MKHETPRTNEIVNSIQCESIPFSTAFWRLLELTRELERELQIIKSSDEKSKDESPSSLAPSRPRMSKQRKPAVSSEDRQPIFVSRYE